MDLRGPEDMSHLHSPAVLSHGLPSGLGGCSGAPVRLVLLPGSTQEPRYCCWEELVIVDASLRKTPQIPTEVKRVVVHRHGCPA